MGVYYGEKFAIDLENLATLEFFDSDANELEAKYHDGSVFIIFSITKQEFFQLQLAWEELKKMKER